MLVVRLIFDESYFRISFCMNSMAHYEELIYLFDQGLHPNDLAHYR
jgi:hypothetical protein